MSVVMNVFVVVFQRLVGVFVRVSTTQNEAHANRSNEQRRDLSTGDRIGEHGPRHDRADEGRCREDELSASCAEITGARDPQRDRRAIPKSTDKERAKDRPSGGRTTECQTNGQIRATGDDSLDERDVRWCQLVEVGGNAVVNSPTEASASNQQRTPAQIGTARPPKHDTGDEDHDRARHHARTDVFAEDEVREQRGEHKL